MGIKLSSPNYHKLIFNLDDTIYQSNNGVVVNNISLGFQLNIVLRTKYISAFVPLDSQPIKLSSMTSGS